MKDIKLNFNVGDIVTDTIDTGEIVTVYPNGIHGDYKYLVLTDDYRFQYIKDDQFTTLKKGKK